MGYSALLQRSRPGAQVGRRTLARPLLLSQRQAGAPTRLARPASPEVRTSTVAPWLVAGGACPRCRGAWRAVARGVWAQPSALWRLGGRGRGEACAAASPRAAARRGVPGCRKARVGHFGRRVPCRALEGARGPLGARWGVGTGCALCPRAKATAVSGGCCGCGGERCARGKRQRAPRLGLLAFAPLPLRSEPRVAVPVG